MKDILKKSRIADWRRTTLRFQPYGFMRAVWLTVSSAALLSAMMIIGAIDPDTHNLERDFRVCYTVVFNFLLFAALYTFNFSLVRTSLKDVWLINLGFLGSMVIGTLAAAVSYFTETMLYGKCFNTFPITLVVCLSTALIAYLICVLIMNINRQQQVLIENEHLKAENLRIRHETLEQQVSPHFLFNSLNTLDGLIGDDDERAHEYLCNLSHMFRYTLQRKSEATLREELAFTHDYIAMMQVRYGNALCVEEKVDPALLDRRLPAISIQLLVENSIKHNVISARHPFAISITADAHVVTVTNNLQPKEEAEASNGIGLDNLNQRYQLLFGVEIEIHKSDNDFKVTIPLQK